MAFHCLKGAYRKAGEGLFRRAHDNRTRENGFKLKEERFRLDVRGKGEVLSYESGEVLEQLPREAVDAPSTPGGVQGQVGWGSGQPDLVNGEVGGPA